MINQTALFASRIDEIYNIYSWLVTRRRGASIARGEGRGGEEGNGGPRKSGAALISTSEIRTRSIKQNRRKRGRETNDGETERLVYFFFSSFLPSPVIRAWKELRLIEG